MRISESLKFATITSQLGNLRERYMATSQQATTGKRVNAPSDDPIAAAANARIQASLSQTQAHRANISSIIGDVQLAESTLDSAGQILQRALELAMSGANGATGANNLRTLAIEANQLADQMVSIGNTKGSRGYLFGGTRTDLAPFDETGEFVGRSDSQQVQIDGGQPMTVSVSGANAFAKDGGRNVMQDLKDLASALSSGNSDAVRALLDGLQESHSQIVQERAGAGLMLDRLTLTDSFLAQSNVNLTAQSSALMDADATETLSTLSQLGTTIQQTVAVDQKLLQMTTVTLTG